MDVTYDPAEQDELLRILAELLRGPIQDGGTKRAAGTKPPWTVDPDHVEAMYRHLARYGRGERYDKDSGAHALVHVACRALMRAWQEMEADGHA